MYIGLDVAPPDSGTQCDSWEYVRGDISSIALKKGCVDCLLCDVPFGRKHGIPQLIAASKKDPSEDVPKACIIEEGVRGVTRGGVPMSDDEDCSFGKLGATGSTKRGAEGGGDGSVSQSVEESVESRGVREMLGVLLREGGRVCREGATMALLTGVAAALPDVCAYVRACCHCSEILSGFPPWLSLLCCILPPNSTIC